jgi:hypothetical protein
MHRPACQVLVDAAKEVPRRGRGGSRSDQHCTVLVTRQSRDTCAILQWRRYALLLNHCDCLNLHHIIRARQASDDEQCAVGDWSEALFTTFRMAA